VRWVPHFSRLAATQIRSKQSVAHKHADTTTGRALSKLHSAGIKLLAFACLTATGVWALMGSRSTVVEKHKWVTPQQYEAIMRALTPLICYTSGETKNRGALVCERWWGGHTQPSPPS
jgi:hypothetical protein